MFRLAIRSARAHWRRFALTSVAVLVGVSFVVGSFVLTDSLAASINQLLSEATTHTDFVVQPAEARGNGGGGGPGGAPGFGGRGGSQAAVPLGLVATLTDVAGVAAADPTVLGGAVVFRAGVDPVGNSDQTVLSNWPDHPDMSAVHLVTGRAPAAPDEVVIDTSLAKRRSLRVGDRVVVGVRRDGFAHVDMRVVGTAQIGAGTGGIAGSLLATTLDRAVEMVGNPGQALRISVRLDAGTDQAAARLRLEAAVGPELKVVSADALVADFQQRIQDRLGTFNGLMLGFAAITVFVSAFLIWNTFSMVIAQRRRELALLRAIGATARQVRGSIRLEAALVGVLCGAAGIGVGVLIAIGLRSLVSGFGVELPTGELVVAPRTIVIALAVGLGATMASVVGPSRRVTRIPPIAALASSAVPVVEEGRSTPLAGSAFLVGGLGLGAFGWMRSTMTSTHRMEYLALGAVALLVSAALLMRYFAAPVISVLSAPIRRVGGFGASLAHRNAVRDPRRSASTASALMIGLALVALTLVLGDSIKSAFGGALRDSITADIVVASGDVVSFDAKTLAAVRSTPSVRRAAAIARTRVTLVEAPEDGTGASNPPGGTDANERDRRKRMSISTGDLAAIAREVDPAFASGGWPSGPARIAVSQDFADEHHVGVGSTVSIDTLDTTGAPRVVTVTGVYRRDELLGDSVGVPEVVAGVAGAEPTTRLVLVTVTDRVGPVVATLDRTVATTPFASARTADDYVSNETNSLDIVLTIVDVLLGFAVAVAAMGIANTLALSVVERTREIGLLRAVGMSRRVVRRMIRVEGVLVAVLGGVLGVGLGTAFGAALAAVLPVDAATLTFPVVRLALLFLAAGVLGIVAAAVPARRGARLDVLEAIAEA